jgi:hypothetical protein
VNNILIQAAMIKYHRLSGLYMTEIYFPQLKFGSQDQCVSMLRFWETGSLSDVWLQTSELLHGAKTQASSVVFSY